MAKKLFIGNLGFDVTEADLAQIFGQCGQVSSARVATDRDSGRSKGFGFVEMPNDDEARHAVDRMDGFDFKGRPMSVEFAKDKPEGAVRAGHDHGSGRRGGRH